MKILGIGNAIVDVICKVNDQYLIENGLTKGTMKLVDEDEFKKLNKKLSTSFAWRLRLLNNRLLYNF